MRALGAISAGAAAFYAVAYLTGQPVNLRLRLPGHRHQGPSPAVWLRQAGLEVTPGQFRAVRMGVGIVVFVVVWGLTASAFVAAPPAVVAAWMPRAYFARRRAERLGEVVRAWPDGIRHVLAVARAKGTIHLALVELARSGPAPLADAFQRYPTLATMAGPVAALETVREELADPTSDAVIEILICAQEQGQALALKILRDLAGEVADDLKALEEIESAGLERKIDSRLTFIIPWLLLVALCATSEAYRGFYRSAGGAFVVVVCGAMSVAGVAVVDRMGRPPRPRRVLGAAAGESR